MELDERTTPATAEPATASHERVAAVLQSVSGVDELPLAERAEVYEQAHAALQAELAGIDGS
jgi:hypothetical protein